MDLQGATVLVSGGAGNLGNAIASALVEAGASVISVDLAHKAEMDERIHCIDADLCDAEAVTKLLTRAEEKVGVPTVVINTAGTIKNALLYDMFDRDDPRHTLDAWDTTVNSNLTTAFMLTREAVARMINSRVPGLVINFSSMAAAGNAGQSAYSAAKAALEALTVTWSKELGPVGIRVNAIAPGFIDTPSTAKALNEKQIANWLKQVPLRRMGTTHEVAHAVRFIIENDYYNGNVLHLDGGLRI